jgi:hypothetical protein
VDDALFRFLRCMGIPQHRQKKLFEGWRSADFTTLSMPSNGTELQPGGTMMVRGITPSAICQLESEIAKTRPEQNVKSKTGKRVVSVCSELIYCGSAVSD